MIQNSSCITGKWCFLFHCWYVTYMLSECCNGMQGVLYIKLVTLGEITIHLSIKQCDRSRSILQRWTNDYQNPSASRNHEPQPKMSVLVQNDWRLASYLWNGWKGRSFLWSMSYQQKESAHLEQVCSMTAETGAERKMLVYSLRFS
jgi:hypothetical protein